MLFFFLEKKVRAPYRLPFLLPSIWFVRKQLLVILLHLVEFVQPVKKPVNWFILIFIFLTPPLQKNLAKNPLLLIL